MISSIPCVIFAGGKSSRMGKDKSLLAFGGYSSMTEFQYKRLKKIFTRVYISTKSSEKFDFKADFIIDKSDVFAPTVGIASVFDTIEDDEFFAISVDTPFISKSTINKMHKQYKKKTILVASNDNRLHPLIAIYPRVIYPQLKQMIDKDLHKLIYLIENSKHQGVPIDNTKEFTNLNFFDEYIDSLQMLE